MHNGRFLADMARVRAAQIAMRLQVVKNIAVVPLLLADSSQANSTEVDEAASVVRTAFTAKAAGRKLTEIEGEGYTVRNLGAEGLPRPTAYFFQESLRLEQQAHDDLREFRLRMSRQKISGQKKRVCCALVLLRHGQSMYNRAKLFTGWADPDLTNRVRNVRS